MWGCKLENVIFDQTIILIHSIIHTLHYTLLLIEVTIKCSVLHFLQSELMDGIN